MQTNDSQRERLERAWHDPSFIEKWERERQQTYQSLRQRAFADGEGRWNPLLPNGWEHHESLGSGAASSSPLEPETNPKQRRQSPGGAEYILPPPKLNEGQVEFPLAVRLGASPDQMQRAAALYKSGLTAKAQRAAHCGILGQRRDCLSDRSHTFYTLYRCGNRYCPTCGVHSFAALFAKHSPLELVARRLVPHWPVIGHKPSRVIAKIDFTTRNTGEMPTAEAIKDFNKKIRKFFRAVERKFGLSRSEYGVIWCDELGGDNTNLHAHGMYAGPWLPQKGKELSALWTRIVGEQAFVSIKIAKSFAAGLAHALKYTAKFVATSTPSRLAELEKAFHGVRRVHTMGAFYNAKVEPQQESAGIEAKGCPHCGGSLVQVPGWRLRPISELNAAGVKNLEQCWIEKGRAQVFGNQRAGPELEG